MAGKNKTRFRSLDIINNNLRIDEAWDEGSDGLWVAVARGWTADPRGAHDIHEMNVREVLARIKGITVCECADCAEVRT